MTPRVSILICTYNRPELLNRALQSVLMQSFGNYEIVVIDDCSDEIPAFPDDPRIRYYRNAANQGALHGDRAHLRWFVNELMRGDYFVYLCDDDYWLRPDLLERQLAYFDAVPSAAMVIGGQSSHFVESGVRAFHEGIHERLCMSSDEFLESFARDPMRCNIITGALLYERKRFLCSGAMQNFSGSKWQSGYELELAPACYGDVIYIDEPCVMAEQRASNASYNRTQLEHYADCVLSLRDAFRQPAKDFPRRGLKHLALRIFDKISEGYLGNAKTIAEHGKLSLCSVQNMARPVTEYDVAQFKIYFLEKLFS